MSRPPKVPISLDALVSGAGLVCSGLFPWTRSGPGSSLRGMELAAALRSSAGLPDWAPRAALGIVGLAVLGLAHLASAVSAHTVARRARFGTGLLILAGLLWIASRYPADRWGPGLALAGVGAVCAVVAGVVHELAARRSPSGRQLTARPVRAGHLPANHSSATRGDPNHEVPR